MKREGRQELCRLEIGREDDVMRACMGIGGCVQIMWGKPAGSRSNWSTGESHIHTHSIRLLLLRPIPRKPASRADITRSVGSRAYYKLVPLPDIQS